MTDPRSPSRSGFSGEIERKLEKIWAAVLKHPVGARENFIDMISVRRRLLDPSLYPIERDADRLGVRFRHQRK